MDILRFTARGWLRRRLAGRSRSKRSCSSITKALTSSSGGKTARRNGHAAPGRAQGLGEGDPIGVQTTSGGRSQHEFTQGVVDQQMRPDLLTDPIGGFAAEYDAGAALMGLDLSKDGLAPPAFAVERGQLPGRIPSGVQQGGDQAITIGRTFPRTAP